MISFILYLKCFAAVLLGLTIHTGTKYNEVKALHTTANEAFTFKDFLKNAIASHIINLSCVLLWMIVLPDLIKAFPKIKDSEYLANIVHIAGCALIGWANSSIILKIFGAGTKYVMDTIDKKTNIADAK
jgi:hypothetical protein